MGGQLVCHLSDVPSVDSVVTGDRLPEVFHSGTPHRAGLSLSSGETERSSVESKVLREAITFWVSVVVFIAGIPAAVLGFTYLLGM